MSKQRDSGDAPGDDDHCGPFDPRAWAEYKRRKAIAFVTRGYSVEWVPDADNWMGIYTPQRSDPDRPEVRADVKFFRDPSEYGINQGRISKLSIHARTTDLMQQIMGRPAEKIAVLYNYDRGLDVDRMSRNRESRALFSAVLEELN